MKQIEENNIMKKVKLFYTPSALPLILEALGYKNMLRGDYLLHVNDGSYVYDKQGDKIKVSEIIGFQKDRIYTKRKM